MTWEYSQSTGLLTYNRAIVATGGYSGKGKWKNDSSSEALNNKGPIPKGRYQIGKPYNDSKKVGPYAIPLTPIGHTAHGRTNFLIHGDNSTSTASEGCIIFSPRSIREKIIDSGDIKLDVTQ